MTYFGVKSRPSNLRVGLIEGQARVPFSKAHSFATLEHHICPLCLAFACCERQSQCMQAALQCLRHTFTLSWYESHRCKTHYLIYVGRRCKWAQCMLLHWTFLPTCLWSLIFEHDNYSFYSIIALIILNFTVAMKCTTWHATQWHPPSSKQADMLLSNFTHFFKTGETIIQLNKYNK